MSTPTTAPAPLGTQYALPPVTGGDTLATVDSVEVRDFHFDGNSVITRRELHDVAERARRRHGSEILTLEQIEQIRQALTAHYVQRGYINSGAILPDQTVMDGILRFEIVEGRLSEVVVHPKRANGKPGESRLSEQYVRDQIDPGSTLNVNELRDQLELLRQDPNIRQVNAELKPGLVPGESILDVSAVEAPLVGVELSFNNHHTPSVGAERLDAIIELQNPTGLGDQFSLTYGVTEGGWDDMRLAGFDAFAFHYALPLSPRGTSLSLDYERSDELVIEQPFADLGITSLSDSFSLTLRHPLQRTPRSELAVFATGAYRTSETFLLGEPFSFEPAADDGRVDLTVLRLGAEYSAARRAAAFSLRGTINIGTGWFGAIDNHGDIADGRFLYFLGQAGYVHRLGNGGALLALRGAAQLTGDSLPSLEQFAIGGYDTVRGYRENRLVRDNGAYGSVELHLPLPGPLREGRPIWELVPFVDAGYGDDHRADGPDDKNFISSVGVGIIASPINHVKMELFYGYPFERFPESSDLQDVGLHFAVGWRFEF